MGAGTPAFFGEPRPVRRQPIIARYAAMAVASSFGKQWPSATAAGFFRWLNAISGDAFDSVTGGFLGITEYLRIRPAEQKLYEANVYDIDEFRSGEE